MKRRFALLLLLLCPIAASARVISYAPYSDQLSMRGYHERTTRHFVLVEAAAANVYDEYVVQGQVVLYDSTGAEPPRVIFGPQTIRAAALHQPRPDMPPVILVIANDRTFISRNYGRSWRQIKELDGFTPHRKQDVDRGGPWTQGLAVPVRIGSGGFPFVVSYRQGVYAISATRAPRLMLSGPTAGNTLLGQNREGTEFLLLTARNTLVAADLNGRWRSIAGPVDEHPGQGWLAADGSVFVLSHGQVMRYANGRRETAGRLSYDETSFAVPTYDFNGFWLLDHHEDAGTTLSRYTPATGLQTMWHDDAAPEVEALHAGASGNTLLIQVHRERGEQELPFIDPALAIWRIGEPAPAEYDELFLNEGPDKGFVHLDVEKAAKGEPFVFDSSFIRPPPPDIIVSPPISGGGDVIQEWGVVRASLKQRLVVQAIARDARWRTDLVIYNPLDQQQKVEVEFDATGDTATITLDANEIRVVADALHTLLGLDEATGALHFLPEKGINVMARVHSAMGSYTVPAVDFFNVTSPRFPVTFAAALPGPDFSSTIVLTDTSGHGIDAEIKTTGSDGLVQSTAAASRETLTSSTPGGAIVQPLRGSLIAGALTIDERSGDASYFTPDIPASAIRTLPFIAHVENADGSKLVSDLHLINLSPRQRSILIEVKPYDTSQWPRSQTYQLKPYESRVITDPLNAIFKLKGMARVRYWSWGAQGDASGVRVTSRTYTTAGNGGTYGAAVPPLNSFQSVTGGESLEVIGLLGGFRASLGLVELSPNPRNFASTVRITIVDDRGNTLDTFDKTIPAAGGLFIDDLFKSRNLPQPAAARVIVEAFDPWTLVGAYAILTDPATGDPTYLGAQLGATPK